MTDVILRRDSYRVAVDVHGGLLRCGVGRGGNSPENPDGSNGLRQRDLSPRILPRPSSWWTQAETGEAFTTAAAQAQRIQRLRRCGIKTPDREWYR